MDVLSRKCPLADDGRYVAMALSSPVFSSDLRPSFMVAGRLAGEAFEIVARPDSRRGIAVDGHVGAENLELDLFERDGQRWGGGFGLGGSLEFTVTPLEGGGKRLEGYVGKRLVTLEARNWGQTIHIEGRAGREKVVLNQWNQFDGHMVSGYIGNKNLSLQARRLPGEPGLDPLEYLPLLMRDPESAPIRAACRLDVVA
ncbi:MAG: hypothetical protein AB1758_05395 [Candidatus Eremiobacterota bacterium]